MALPSQSLSRNARGRYMYRRRRKHRIPMVGVTIAAVILCGFVWWILDARSDSKSQNTETLAAAPAPAVSPPTAHTGAPATSSYDAHRRSRTLESTVHANPPSGWHAPAPSSPRAPSQPVEVVITPTTTPAPPAPPIQSTTLTEASRLEIIPPASGSQSDVISEGRHLLAANRPVEARTLLSNSLINATLSPGDADEARYMLEAINERLVFSQEIVSADPYSIPYTVQPGDSLARIVKNLGLQVDWRFIQRINGLRRPDLIQVGQSLKIITGPFHAEISRDSHRLDLYLGEGKNRVYIRDYLVGLGEHDCTPGGLFRVRRHSKLINPPWTDPRSRVHFTASDPMNPIGEYWLGLEGIEDHNQQESGFGLHGTIDPGSIGRNESMGCVRMNNGEIDVIYEVLTEGVSTVWVDDLGTTVNIPGG